MEKNKIIEILEKKVGTNTLAFISGTIENPGTKDCKLSDERGSVYGVAVKLTSENEKKEVFKHCKKEISIEEWKSIGDYYYPLYWGRDINMGARLFSHTKSSKSTGTIQLNKHEELKNKDVIYGAMPCSNYKEIESKLHKEYPDIYKTQKNDKEEGLLIECLSEDEDT